MINRPLSTCIALLLVSSAGVAQQFGDSSMSGVQTSLQMGTQMPGMEMPSQKPSAPSTASSPAKPGMQTPQGAERTIHQHEQAPQEMQMGGEHMQMQSPASIAGDVSQVQEPENPARMTGSDSPVIDRLAGARKAPRRALAEFEQEALKTSPALKQSEALARSSAGLAKQAGMWSNPSIGYQGEQIRGGSYGGGEHGAFIQQNVVLGGKLQARRNVYEQQQKGEELGVEEQRLSVLGAVRGQFYSALAAQQSAEIKQQLLQLALDAAATSHQLANVGQADAPDVLQAEVEAEQAKLDLEIAQQHYIGQYRTLCALAGSEPTSIAMLEGRLEEPPQVDPEKQLQQVLADSPAIKRAEQEVSTAKAVLQRNEKEAVPDLTLRVGEQQNLEHTSAGRAVGAQSFATASIPLPLFNRNQGNIEAASADIERATAGVERARILLLQRAEPLVESYLTSRLRAERYRTEMLPRARRAYELYLKKYQEMAAAYPEVLISQRKLFHLEEDYAQAVGELWVARAHLQNVLVDEGRGEQIDGLRNTEVNPPTGGPGGAQ